MKQGMENIIKDNIKVEGFGIERAYVLVKKGHRIARKGWNGKGLYVKLLKALECKCNKMPDILVITSDKEDAILTPWVPSQSDQLAEDWMLVK